MPLLPSDVFSEYADTKPDVLGQPVDDLEYAQHVQDVDDPSGVRISFYLFIYLFAQAHTLRTIRQGLEQDSKAQRCTDSYPKITENPTQYKSKVKSK